MPILLKDATYIDWKTLDFKRTNILIDNELTGKIKFINSHSNIPDGTDYINCEGLLVTKSFAVGHHHAYSALARGMPAPKKTPKNFNEILQYIWWNIDKKLDKDMIEASALATALACAKSGATFVIDHHASPNYIGGSLDIIAKAFEKVGLSHLLCYEITDRDGLDKANEGLAETDNYLKNNQGLVGLHASFTVGDETMKKAADMMQKHNSGIHIHVAEDMYDQQHCRESCGKRVVERFKKLDLLNSPKTILGHCLHINDYERDIIKNSPVYVVQNTESNQNNNVGYFDSKGLSKNIMLGTDGMHSDMIRSAQSAFFAGQRFDTIDFASAYERFRNVHNYLSANDFEGDDMSNLVVLDYDSPTEINKDNFLGHFIYGLSSNHVRHVISNGKFIVRDKKVQTVDEKEILKFAREQSKRLWAVL